MTTYPQAIDDMFGMVLAGVTADAPAIIGGVPEIRWEGVEEPALPPTDDFWLRVGTQHLNDRQSTLRSGVAPTTQQRYSETGILIIQLYCPMSDATAYEKGRALAVALRALFLGVESANGVWFRNARKINLPLENGMYRFNVVVDYEYDSIA